MASYLGYFFTMPTWLIVGDGLFLTIVSLFSVNISELQLLFGLFLLFVVPDLVVAVAVVIANAYKHADCDVVDFQFVSGQS